MEQDGPYGGPGPIGGGPKLPAVRVDPGVGLVGEEACSESKVLLSNGGPAPDVARAILALKSMNNLDLKTGRENTKCDLPSSSQHHNCHILQYNLCARL